jgi:hypothetical protein
VDEATERRIIEVREKLHAIGFPADLIPDEDVAVLAECNIWWIDEARDLTGLTGTVSEGDDPSPGTQPRPSLDVECRHESAVALVGIAARGIPGTFHLTAPGLKTTSFRGWPRNFSFRRDRDEAWCRANFEGDRPA